MTGLVQPSGPMEHFALLILRDCACGQILNLSFSLGSEERIAEQLAPWEHLRASLAHL